MDALRLGLAIGLPWLAGAAWVRLGWRERRAGAGAVVAGYGFVLGTLGTTLLLRVQDLAGLRLGFAAPALALAALAAVGFALERRRDPPPARPDRAALASGERLAVLGIAALLALRFAGLAAELVWRPLYAWDAWASWGARARVWFERREIVPFVSWAEWVERAPAVYTLPAWDYPGSVPLIQVWASLALGRWDDSLMNLAWLGCAAALGLGLYGQSRLWGVAPLSAAAAAYALLSLPLLETQVGLPGAADLWQAAVFGLAALAFLIWWRDRDRRQGLLALLLAIASIGIKRPGLGWALTFLVPLVLGRLPLRRALALAAVAATALALGASALGVPVSPRPEAAAALAESLFSLASWHLLWYLLAGVALLRGQRLLRDPSLRPGLLLVLAGLGFIGGVYFLTPRAEWALDFTQLNRALLHITPLLVFVATLALDPGTRGAPTASGAPPAPDPAATR